MRAYQPLGSEKVSAPIAAPIPKPTAMPAFSFEDAATSFRAPHKSGAAGGIEQQRIATLRQQQEKQLRELTQMRNVRMFLSFVVARVLLKCGHTMFFLYVARKIVLLHC